VENEDSEEEQGELSKHQMQRPGEDKPTKSLRALNRGEADKETKIKKNKEKREGTKVTPKTPDWILPTKDAKPGNLQVACSLYIS